MISVEWDWNEAKKIWLEEGEEKGFIEGMAKGIAKGKSEGIIEELAKGRTEVYKELLSAGLLTPKQLKEIGKLSDDEIKALQ